MTMRIALFSVAAMLLVAGCGGSTNVSSGSSAGEVAGIVPADVSVLVAFETDRDSEQWQRADELLLQEGLGISHKEVALMRTEAAGLLVKRGH